MNLHLLFFLLLSPFLSPALWKWLFFSFIFSQFLFLLHIALPSQVVKFALRPLSLHYKVHVLTQEELERPRNKVKFAGKASWVGRKGAVASLCIVTLTLSITSPKKSVRSTSTPSKKRESNVMKCNSSFPPSSTTHQSFLSFFSPLPFSRPSSTWRSNQNQISFPSPYWNLSIQSQMISFPLTNHFNCFPLLLPVPFLLALRVGPSFHPSWVGTSNAAWRGSSYRWRRHRREMLLQECFHRRCHCYRVQTEWGKKVGQHYEEIGNEVRDKRLVNQHTYGLWHHHTLSPFLY